MANEVTPDPIQAVKDWARLYESGVNEPEMRQALSAESAVAQLVWLLLDANFPYVENAERGGIPCWEVVVDGRRVQVAITAVPD